jgi:hypothetical protein
VLIQGCKDRGKTLLVEKEFIQKAPPNLQVIVVKKSTKLARFYVAIFVALSGCSLVAWLSLTQHYILWGITFSIFMSLALIVIASAIRAQKPLTLWVEQGVWWVSREDTRLNRYCLRSYVVCWAGIIIIPLESTVTKEHLTLLIVEDAVDAEAWHRLRIWIRSCLNYRS